MSDYQCYPASVVMYLPVKSFIYDDIFYGSYLTVCQSTQDIKEHYFV